MFRLEILCPHRKDTSVLPLLPRRWDVVRDLLVTPRGLVSAFSDVYAGVQLRKVVAVLAAAAVGVSLFSCSEARPPDASRSTAMGYEPSVPIARTPLTPPGSTPGPLYADPPLSTPYDDPLPEGRQPVGNWNASPRWSAIQGDGCIVVNQAAGAGAGNMNVEKCSSGQ